MPPVKRTPKTNDSLLFNGGAIETEQDWQDYLKQEKLDLVRIMPEWAVDNFQDPKTVEYIMATCRRLGKSTWTIIFALYRLTRLSFVNHVIAVKYFARIKVTILTSIQNCLEIMRHNELLGSTPAANQANYLQMATYCVGTAEFTWCGRKIFFTSLQKPEHALGAQANSMTKSSVPVVFNLFIIDEIMYQDDKKVDVPLTYEKQIEAINSIKSSLVRGLPNPFVRLTLVYLFNSWDAGHPIYYTGVESVFKLLEDRYQTEERRMERDHNRHELLEGSGLLNDMVSTYSTLDGVTIEIHRRVVVASYRAIPLERRTSASFIEIYNGLIDTEGKSPDQIAADYSQWEIEFGGMPGSYIDTTGLFYNKDYRIADMNRIDIENAITPERLIVGFDRGQVDANSLWFGVIATIDGTGRRIVVPLRTEIWYSKENRNPTLSKLPVRNLTESIDYIMSEVDKVHVALFGRLSGKQRVWCDSRSASDFISAFNNTSIQRGAKVFMEKYYGEKWGLAERQDTEKSALTSGTLRFPTRESEDKCRYREILNGEKVKIIDNSRLEEAFANCRQNDAKDARDERPKRNSWYLDVLNSMEYALAECKYIVQGGGVI